jgi:hypothetical protein
MCSILGIFDVCMEAEAVRRRALELSRRQRHRGPDWSGVWAGGGAVLVHERLAIVAVEGGAQPIVSAAGDLALAVNGEIYNHREIEAGLARPYAFQTGSDCEVINALWREAAGPGFLDRLNGIFAFALVDRAEGRYLVGPGSARRLPALLGARRARPAPRGVGDEGAGRRLQEPRRLPARPLLRQPRRRAAPLPAAGVARSRGGARHRRRSGRPAPGARGGGQAPVDDRRAVPRAAVGRPRLLGGGRLRRPLRATA